MGGLPLHKVVCDSLGLRNSDNEDLTFHVTATEQERRTTLREAFDTTKKEDGVYGSLVDVVAVATQFAPKDSQSFHDAWAWTSTPSAKFSAMPMCKQHSATHT